MEGVDLGQAIGRNAFGEELAEEVDDLGVELGARVDAKLVERRLVVARRLVRPVVDHGVVRVGDGYDARPERDLLAPQPVRIAAAVEVLVVVEHDRHRLAQRGGLLQDHLTDARVLPDRLPVEVRESRRLVQDLGRDRQLA